MKGLAGRLDQPMPVGNEGAGVVVRAGASPEAQALIGKTVAILGGGMYTQYRCINAKQCLVLPPGTTPRSGWSLCLRLQRGVGVRGQRLSRGRSCRGDGNQGRGNRGRGW